jgi:ABC-type transport system substrate-binding protein
VTNADESPKRGGTYRVATKENVNTLDAHLFRTGAQATFEQMFYDDLINLVLVDISGTHEMVPDVSLASSWSFPDLNTVIVNIRPGAKFHDGSEYNAEVAKWNVDRQRTEPRSVEAARMAAIGSVDVVDPWTIRLNIPVPTVAVLQTWAGRNWQVSKALYDQLGEEKFGRTPAGTGPMKLRKWVPDSLISLERADGYWRDGVDGKPLPYIDALTDRAIPEGSVAIAELKTNQLDLYHELESIQIPTVEDDPDLVLWLKDWTGTRRPLVGFNRRSGPFTEIKLRKAALYAMNREVQAKAFGPTASVHKYPLSYPIHFDYDETRPTYDYNPTLAKQLVCEVDADCQVEVELNHIAREPDASMALVLKALWDEVGIKTSILAQDVQSWVDINNRDLFEVTFWKANPYGIDPHTEYPRVNRESSGNWNNNDTPGFQECYDEAAIELDQAKRKTIYDRCYLLLYEDASLGVAFLEVPNFVYRKEAKGLGVKILLESFLQEVWLDR